MADCPACFDVTTFLQGLIAGAGLLIALAAPVAALALEAHFQLPPNPRTRLLTTLGGECLAVSLLCLVASMLVTGAPLKVGLLAAQAVFVLTGFILVLLGNRWEERVQLRRERAVGRQVERDRPERPPAGEPET